jgi:hypothetical protein
MYLLDPDRTVSPCQDVVEWHSRMGLDDRVVGLDEIGRSTVLTTFLGVADGTNSRGQPLVFSTIIHKGPMDGRTWRWATYHEALDGHRKAVEAVHVLEGA